jgi:hypothetical protein
MGMRRAVTVKYWLTTADTELVEGNGVDDKSSGFLWFEKLNLLYMELL